MNKIQARPHTCIPSNKTLTLSARTCTYTYTRTCTHAQTQPHPRTVLIRANTYEHANAHAPAPAHAQAHAHTRTRTQMQTHTHTRTQTHTYMHTHLAPPQRIWPLAGARVQAETTGDYLDLLRPFAARSSSLCMFKIKKAVRQIKNEIFFFTETGLMKTTRRSSHLLSGL